MAGVGRTPWQELVALGIQRRLAADKSHGIHKPSKVSRERLLKAISSLERSDGGLSMQVLGTTSDMPVTAIAVAEMLEACARSDVRSLADFSAALREPMPPIRRDRLREAMRLAKALGFLPQERDTVDGPRSGLEDRGKALNLSSSYLVYEEEAQEDVTDISAKSAEPNKNRSRQDERGL